MPRLPTLLARNHDFLGSAEAAHRAHGLDWPLAFATYFEQGHICKGPDWFILFHEDPATDSWQVYWAESSDPSLTPRQMVRRFLRLMPHYRPNVCWARGLRGTPPRMYSTERLLRFTA